LVILGAFPCGRLLAEEPRFLLATTTGSVTGSFRALASNGTLELQATELVKSGPAQWYALRRVGEPQPPLPGGTHVVLTSGDRIPLTRPRIEGEKFFFQHPDFDAGKETSVSLGCVSLLWWATPAQTDGEILRRRLLRERRKEDVTLLRNGDRVPGVPTQLDVSRLLLQIEGGNRSLDLKQVACLALNTDLAESLRPTGRYYQMTFRGRPGQEATRVCLASLSSDGETVGGKTLFGATVRLPVERLLAIDVYRGPADVLTDLKLAGTTQTPYLDWRWQVGIDGTATDQDLRLGNDTHARGLALVAGTSATFQLEGKYRRFEALVGLDSRLGREGGVKLEVLGDGKPMTLESPELTGNGMARSLVVDVSGVKELTLTVQPGRRGAVQGHVNWADAWLVK
jgi:hypothetical protein